MDIERTIQFILESQAKAEVRMQKAESRMQKTETRIDGMEKRFDRRMNGIAKLLQHGMRMLAKTETTLAELAEAQAKTETKLAELAEAQKETDRSLKAFINSLRHGRNGR